MDKSFKYVLSYPDSQKMLDEALKKDRAIDRLIYDFGAYETKKEATKAVNSLLYEIASNKGISLYDLCFRTIPEWGTPDVDIDDTDMSRQRYSIKQTLKIVPVEFDLTHDGGYWKKKYFALKKKLQELIDSKED